MSAGPVIAIVMGDPAGIGPELIVKVLAEDGWRGRCRPFIIGDLQVMRATAASLGCGCSGWRSGCILPRLRRSNRCAAAAGQCQPCNQPS